MSLYTDNFNAYANGNLDSVDTNWTTDLQNSTNFQISSGVLQLHTSNNQSDVIYSAGTGFSQSQFSAITLANQIASGANEGPGVNLSAGTGYALAVISGGKWQFVKLTGGGGASVIGSQQSGLTLGPTDTYQLNNNNGTLVFTMNGTQQGYTVTDTTYTGGKPGIYCFIGVIGAGDITLWQGGTENLAVVAWY